MSRASKIRRKYRKAVTRTLAILRVNFIIVGRLALRDRVWNVTPDEVAICVEAMLFTLANELAKWPDDWTHKHVFWDDPARFVPADGRCSCGAGVDVDFDGVHDVLGMSPTDIADPRLTPGMRYTFMRDLHVGNMRIAPNVSVYGDGYRLSCADLDNSGGRGTFYPTFAGTRARAFIDRDRWPQATGIFALLEMGPPQG